MTIQGHLRSFISGLVKGSIIIFGLFSECSEDTALTESIENRRLRSPHCSPENPFKYPHKLYTVINVILLATSMQLKFRPIFIQIDMV